MSKHPKRTSHFVEQVREQTNRYLHELAEENEMLRHKVEIFECDKHLLESKLDDLRDQVSRERDEREKLLARVQAMENLRASWAAEYAVVEEQNNNLASLYSATYSLHGTLDRGELLDVIKEIVANLIGSEEMAIFELDEEGERLQLAASMGVDAEPLRSVSVHAGIIGHTVRTGTQYLPERTGEVTPAAYEADLTACVPLCFEDQITGAIALFRLLPQKQGLVPLDHELFDLLASQAAVALFSAKVHEGRRPAAGE